VTIATSAGEDKEAHAERSESGRGTWDGGVGEMGRVSQYLYCALLLRVIAPIWADWLKYAMAYVGERSQVQQWTANLKESMCIHFQA